MARIVLVRYRVMDLLWRAVGRMVRFVIMPPCGTIFLLCTDLTLESMQILQLYGYRFKFEIGFKQAVHLIGAHAYSFPMSAMKPMRRGTGDQLHRITSEYRDGIRRKLLAYHAHMQLGCIAQGLLPHLAINHTAAVWHVFRSWLRTVNEAMPPSELVVACALRTGLPRLFAVIDSIPGLKKIVDTYRRHDVFEESRRRAA